MACAIAAVDLRSTFAAITADAAGSRQAPLLCCAAGPAVAEAALFL
jgi:hypothetical protein